MLLADGTLVIFHVSSGFKNCSTDALNYYSNCADIYVDTNGYYKGPNQFGKDSFLFAMKKDRIIPYGTKRESPKFSQACNKYSSYGYDCTAWVIQNENMDYLHCDDLDWNKKIKCK